ncbi:hypothetical protein AX17_001564 [Amanita inopinata Kibby_2008]|nr:hypothetical protein AX17_001564 [Amanita inopinata Kibby_2008]
MPASLRIMFFHLFATICIATTSAQQLPNLPPGVLASGTMGVTNPPQATMATSINQTSMARLLTVNSIDDFCIFAPPTMQNIGDSETVEVAWCTQPRNNARLIPDGTLTGLSFLKTDMYIQILGYGNFTRLNIPFGDYGGELDPHGAYGAGNPVGGNVTSDVTGTDLHYQEWMLYISYNTFCLRICTNANATYSAESMCWHQLDLMGCNFVMPGNYDFDGTFESCEADIAYPPGWYPTDNLNGSPVFSTFAQRYTGTLPNGYVYTVGDLSTPSAPYMTPSSSSCSTTPTIANNVPLTILGLPENSPTSTGSPSGTRSGGSRPTSVSNINGSPSDRDYLPHTLLLALFTTPLATMLFH